VKALNARPDLAAHQQVIRASTQEVVTRLVELLGARLVAYIGGVGETRAVREWMIDGRDHREPRGDTSPRLREALTIALMLASREKPPTIQAWLMGLNPQLDDRAPARLLRDGDADAQAAVLGAARAFLIGG
jgi:hypothetical protein